MDKKQYIEQMPKVELHLHLDGAFTLEFLLSLIQKYGGDSEINTIDDLEKRFEFKDFPHFIQTWFWKNQYFREPPDFEESTYRTLEKMKYQNIVYSEAFISPWDYQESGVSPTDIAIANCHAVKRAKMDFGIECKLIVDITRDHGHKHALERLDQIFPYVGDEIIGIGLGGSEHLFPARDFKEVFLEAKRRGLHCVAHAGEVVGPESVWSAIQDLQVERIGHGVRSIEDPKLLEYLREKQIPLEVCIISNLKTGVYSEVNKHPINDLFHEGLLVSVNSDDPTMFGSTLADEYLILLNELNFTLPEIRHIQNNAVESLFASSDKKRLLKEQINQYWLDNAI